MIAALLTAAAVAGSPAPASAAPAPTAASAPTVADTAHAIEVGRLDQARIMIARLVASGARGPRIERLVADVDFASGNYAQAAVRYRQLAVATPGDSYLCERAEIAALKIADVAGARRWTGCATAGPNASWRAWNARGVVADLTGDWVGADAAFERAAALAPDRPEITNNRGWSQLMRGNWSEAERLFAQAAGSNPQSPRVTNNLELARSALATELPQRLPRETDGDWAARLNDVGVASELLGDRKKAVAAFTAALRVSGSWYPRAANNLKAAGWRQ